MIKIAFYLPFALITILTGSLFSLFENCIFFVTVPNVTMGNPRMPQAGPVPQQQTPTLTALLDNPPYQGQPQPGQQIRQPQPQGPMGAMQMGPQGQMGQTRMAMAPVPIWKGELNWPDKTTAQQTSVMNSIGCSVTPYQTNPQPPPANINTSNWPSKLRMQLVQKTLIGSIGQHHFKTATTVLFHMDQGETLTKLTNMFSQGQCTGVVVSGYHLTSRVVITHMHCITVFCFSITPCVYVVNSNACVCTV